MLSHSQTIRILEANQEITSLIKESILRKTQIPPQPWAKPNPRLGVLLYHDKITNWKIKSKHSHAKYNDQKKKKKNEKLPILYYKISLKVLLPRIPMCQPLRLFSKGCFSGFDTSHLSSVDPTIFLFHNQSRYTSGSCFLPGWAVFCFLSC